MFVALAAAPAVSEAAVPAPRAVTRLSREGYLGVAEGRVSGQPGSLIGRAFRWLGNALREQAVDIVGGPARARVIFLFGAVLALNSADVATIGAVASKLEPALHIGNAKLGLLASVTLLVGALAVIPVGMLVDRINRVRLLSISIVLWSLASFASGISGSYSQLLLTRLALGAVTATAGPAIGSLTGDYFPTRERGRVYGYILAGEVAGTAIGFIISGSIASLLSWRWAFFALAIPGFFLAKSLWTTVPEPKRGGSSRLQRGVVDLFEVAAEAHEREAAETDDPVREDELAHEAARERGIQPDPKLVLTEDPAGMSLWRAVKYVLKVPTNVTLIIASALGYFFLAGLQTFIVVFVRGHYHVNQATATGILGLLVVGALIGTLVSGRLTDWMLHRGVLNSRIWVPAVCYVGAAVLLIPGLTSKHLTPGLWFDIAGAALISAANPPLDAARLDIMAPGLWGRAESVRTLLRTLAQATAPLLFGAFADLVAGFTPKGAPIGTKPGEITSSTTTGLEVTFLVMLVSLAAGGIFMLRARHTYPRDVATAAASAEASGKSPQPRPA